MINIVCTSKPCDGLFYYSYEHCLHLNTMGIKSQVAVINHRKHTRKSYLEAIDQKYTVCENIVFDCFPDANDVTVIMGRSMLTFAWLFLEFYTEDQKRCLRQLFSRKLISVYSENHPEDYLRSLGYYRPHKIIDLCDYAVYPNGTGDAFEKHINFEFYKPHVNSPQFKYLFLGTNKEYYETANEMIVEYLDHGIVTYNEPYINQNNNNIFVPVNNLMGLFDIYVYNKKKFDPAPRIIQECKKFGKKMIYCRDQNIRDGGKVYWERPLKPIDAQPIIKAMEKLL